MIKKADGLTFKVKENDWAMLKIGASQHFQEVTHESPRTEREEKRSVWVMRFESVRDVCVCVWVG